MSAKKFEKLIDLIINEDQERANQLFHEIVVEKSREIYESIIDEDSIEGLEDDVSADEEGMAEGMDDEGMDDMDDIGGDDFGDEDFGGDDFGDEEGEAEFGDEEDGEFGDEEGELEDRVVDLEDKLDELMAEFEAQMGDDEGEEDFGGEEDMDDMGDDEGEEDFGGDEGDDEEAGLMEAALKQVGGKTYDKFSKGGDDGIQTKSPGLQNPTRVSTGGKAVGLGGGAETVPTSAKKPSNPYAKGEKTENFGNVNVPGGNAGKTGFKTKAPAPKAESVKAKSPVAEAKRTTKRRI
jgi:hypothetical protein